MLTATDGMTAWLESVTDPRMVPFSACPHPGDIGSNAAAENKNANLANADARMHVPPCNVPNHKPQSIPVSSELPKLSKDASAGLARSLA
jgi:hypothetical protein